METLSDSVTTRELRSRLSEVLGRVRYGSERIGITRNGKLTAVLVDPDDLALLEEFEMARDVADYRAAKAEDDGARKSLDELRRSAAS